MITSSLVQTQVTLCDIIRGRPLARLAVGWVQPTILHSVTSGGLHPPYALRTIEGAS